MTGDDGDPLRERVEARVGEALSSSGPLQTPDEVNVPMIRHWVDALDDRNSVYLDAAFAATTRFGGIVAPPAMLQTWTMARPRIKGIAQRGGAADEIDPESPIAVLAAGVQGVEVVAYPQQGECGVVAAGGFTTEDDRAVLVFQRPSAHGQAVVGSGWERVLGRQPVVDGDHRDAEPFAQLSICGVFIRGLPSIIAPPWK